MQEEIKNILDSNRISDLKHFLNKRHSLNKCNAWMIYFFHIIQSTGILATSIAASSGNQNLLWCGISLNMIASIIQVYEKINNDQMKKLLIDIKSIENGTYTDESTLYDPESVRPQEESK